MLPRNAGTFWTKEVTAPMEKTVSINQLAQGIEPSIRSDKSDHYFNFYSDLFEDQRQLPLRILEIGVFHGGSTLLFAQYFQEAEILAIDINDPPQAFFDELVRLGLSERVQFARVSQSDPQNLMAIVERHFADKQLDLIIDDASHFYAETRSSFMTLFPTRLREGGTYVIEDWGCGYWPTWPDGNSAGADGLPRLIKELVDAIALPDRTRQEDSKRVLPTQMQLPSPIRQAVITCSIAALVRSDGEMPGPEVLFGHGPDRGSTTGLRELLRSVPAAFRASARPRIVRIREWSGRIGRCG
jgi:SAM-dependent methyltransferase